MPIFGVLSIGLQRRTIMNPKPVIKPTRRELLDVAIGEYCKRLRAQQVAAQKKVYELEAEVRAIEKQKEARLLAHVRIPHADRIEAIRKAVEPFGGRMYEGVNHLGVSGISHFTYSVSLDFREEIKSGPDYSDLEAQIVEKHNLKHQHVKEADDFSRRASKVDNLDLFKHIVGSLPPEAGELLDKLAVMIGDALGDREDLTVVVHDLNTNLVVEVNPCHSRIQAESLQKKLSQEYQEGFSVEIQKP